jgi:hypothetical protein
LALITRETVAVETPANFAMSFTVAWLMPFLPTGGASAGVNVTDFSLT